MTRVHNPGGVPQAFREYRDEVADKVQAKATQVQTSKVNAERRLESSPLADSWAKAKDSRWGADVALTTLLEEVHPWHAGQLADLMAESKQLATVVHSFDALCERLASNQGPPVENVTETSARGQYKRRTELLNSVSRVEKAIAAAGAAAGNFPTGQLQGIKAQLQDDAAAILKRAEDGGRVLKPSLHLKSFDELADPIAHLTRALGAPELAEPLHKAMHAAPDPAAFKENLAASAVLLDEAQAAPDYTQAGKGWFHPSSRRDYRARTHDAFSRFASADRQQVSGKRMKDMLEQVVAYKDPSALLDNGLKMLFMQEVGWGGHDTQHWKPDTSAVKAALLGELLVPLRALTETRASMTKGDPTLRPSIDRAVSNIVQHVVQGDYAEWRYDNPVSKHQLGGLDEGQLAAWKSDNHVQMNDGETQLSTREEDGLGLPWVTKIGGPSHGFDYGGECLLPLLSNGRTKAILIDDPKWPHNAAARAYIRLLHREDGSPTLYLEPFQRDFPHREQFGDTKQLNDFFYSAIVKHAVQKADEMGLPLSIGRQYKGVLEGLGLEAKMVETRSCCVRATGSTRLRTPSAANTTGHRCRTSSPLPWLASSTPPSAPPSSWRRWACEGRVTASGSCGMQARQPVGQGTS